MDGKNYSHNILQQKKDLFLQTVHNACKERNLPVPSVNFEGCPAENENQLAHIHTVSNVICISEFQLNKLNFEDIKDTATHEVVHILHQDHGGEFHREHQNIRGLIWRPPSGVVFVKGEHHKAKPSKAKKKLIVKDECDRHGCKNKSNLQECVFCHYPFCTEHISAKLVTLPNFRDETTDADLRLKEWRREDAHPCPEYTDYWHKNGGMIAGKQAPAQKTADEPKSPEKREIKSTAYSGAGVGRKDYVESYNAAASEEKIHKHEPRTLYNVLSRFHKILVSYRTDRRLTSEDIDTLNRCREGLLKNQTIERMSTVVTSDNFQDYLAPLLTTYRMADEDNDQMVKAVIRNLSEYIENSWSRWTLSSALDSIEYEREKNENERARVRKEEQEKQEKHDKTWGRVFFAGKILIVLSLLLLVSLVAFTIVYPKQADSFLSFNEGLRGWKNEVMHTMPCTERISHDTCLQLKPLYCNNGRVADNAFKCGCGDNQREYNNSCVVIVKCSDGTLAPDCSTNKPYQCLDGNLVSVASVCGCPDNYMAVNESCAEIKRCTDGTIYGQCSTNQPLICENGALHERASMCGCPEGLTIESIGNTNGEKCVINRNFNTQTSSASVNLYDVETQIHTLINEQRSASGLPALTFDEALSSIARKHSQDMASRSYFEHNTPEGHDFYWRMQQDGYNCAIPIGNTIYQGAENIFKESGYSTSAIASTTVNGWMSSSGHRANILTSYWRNEGIGVAKSSSGTIYVTQDFC